MKWTDFPSDSHCCTTECETYFIGIHPSPLMLWVSLSWCTWLRSCLEQCHREKRRRLTLPDSSGCAGSHRQSLTARHFPAAWWMNSTIPALLPGTLQEQLEAYEIKLMSTKDADQSLNSIFCSSNVLYFLLGAFTAQEWCSSISSIFLALVNNFLFLIPSP